MTTEIINNTSVIRMEFDDIPIEFNVERFQSQDWETICTLSNFEKKRLENLWKEMQLIASK